MYTLPYTGFAVGIYLLVGLAALIGGLLARWFARQGR